MRTDLSFCVIAAARRPDLLGARNAPGTLQATTHFDELCGDRLRGTRRHRSELPHQALPVHGTDLVHSHLPALPLRANRHSFMMLLVNRQPLAGPRLTAVCPSPLAVRVEVIDSLRRERNRWKYWELSFLPLPNLGRADRGGCGKVDPLVSWANLFAGADSAGGRQGSRLPGPLLLVARTHHTSSSARIGSCRMRFLVAAKIALHTAGAIGGVPGSPVPLEG